MIRILIVDDDPEFRSMLASALMTEGFEVTTSVNGLQALHAVAREHPNLVLLDYMMPVLDAPGFVERLGNMDDHPAVIAMSGKAISRAELEEVGALAFLPKPFDLDKLREQIRIHSDRLAS